MQHKAYAVVTIRRQTGQLPVVTGVGVYSESAKTLTIHSRNVAFADVFDVSSDSYADAERLAQKTLREMWPWLAELLS